MNLKKKKKKYENDLITKMINNTTIQIIDHHIDEIIDVQKNNQSDFF